MEHMEDMAGSNSSDLLSKLPLELKVLICEYLCDHCILGWDAPLEVRRAPHISSSPLLSLCRVSRSMREVAQPVLFHFFCEATSLDDHVMPKFLAFEKATRGRGLAQCVKSLSLCHANADSWNERESQSDSTDPRRFQYNSRAALLLRRTTRVEQLEIRHGSVWACSSRWVPSFANLQYLKELALHGGFDGHFDRKKVSAFLENTPGLVKLTLSEYDQFDDSFYEKVQNIRHLTLIDRLPEYPKISTVQRMIEAMPQLESIKLCTPGYSVQFRCPDFLAALLVRKDTLKELTLHKLYANNDTHLLEQFPEIHDLDLLVNAPMVINGKCVLPSRSLKRLILYKKVFRFRPDNFLVELISNLRESLHRYPKLEVIHVIVINDENDPRMAGHIEQLCERIKQIWGHEKLNVRLTVQKNNCDWSCSVPRAWGLTPKQREDQNILE